MRRTDLLLIDRIERVGEVGGERFEQGDLLGVEGMGIAGIERQRADGLTLAAERERSRRPKT